MERMIVKITNSLQKRQVVSADDSEVFAYGMDLLVFTGLTKLALLVFGVIANCFWETTLYTISFSILQTLGGGYHAKTHLRCFATTSVLWGYAMLLLFSTPVWAHYIYAIVGVVITYKLSPIENPNAPMGIEKRMRMRWLTRGACTILAFVSVFLAFTSFRISSTIMIAIGLSGMMKMVAQITMSHEM